MARRSARTWRRNLVSRWLNTLRAIEFVKNYAHIGKGQGGWREDYQFFSQEAGI
jgi:hypothetical protein